MVEYEAEHGTLLSLLHKLRRHDEVHAERNEEALMTAPRCSLTIVWRKTTGWFLHVSTLRVKHRFNRQVDDAANMPCHDNSLRE